MYNDDLGWNDTKLGKSRLPFGTTSEEPVINTETGKSEFEFHLADFIKVPGVKDFERLEGQGLGIWLAGLLPLTQ